VFEYEVMGLENKKIVLRFLLSYRPNFSVAAWPNYVKGLQLSLQQLGMILKCATAKRQHGCIKLQSQV
jgi:hypothetical protein